MISSWLLLVWSWLVTSTKLCREVGFLNFLLVNEGKRGEKLQSHNIKTLGKSLLSEWPSPSPIMLRWCNLIKVAMYSWAEEQIPGYLGVLESIFSLWTWEKDSKTEELLFINNARKRNKRSACSQRTVSSIEEMKKYLHVSEVGSEIK